MPKTKIVERDLTSSATSDGVSSVVYIPCKATTSNVALTLCSTASQLIALTTSDTDGKLDSTSDNYKIAFYLIAKYKMQVLVEGIVASSSSYLISDASKKALTDKLKYDIRFLTLGNDFIENTNANAKVLIDVATTRGDCIALIDHAKALTSGSDAVGDVRDYFDTFNTYKSNNSYCNYCSPWWKSDKSTVTANDVTVTLPEELAYSIGYLFAYKTSIDKGNPEYYAIANKDRGTITELVKPLYEYGTYDIERLQGRSDDDGTIELDANGDNVGYAVNVIANIRPFGYVIWGNRTSLNNPEIETGEYAGTGDLKATSFLNVRQMLCTIKKKMYDVANEMKFEQNSDVLFLNYKTKMASTLDGIKNSYGMKNYEWIKEETTRKARMKATLRIIHPIEGFEDAELTVELTNDTETVSE